MSDLTGNPDTLYPRLAQPAVGRRLDVQKQPVSAPPVTVAAGAAHGFHESGIEDIRSFHGLSAEAHHSPSHICSRECGVMDMGDKNQQ